MTKSLHVLDFHPGETPALSHRQAAVSWAKVWTGLLAIALTLSPLLASCQPKASNTELSETNTLPSQNPKNEQPKHTANKPSSQDHFSNNNAGARKITFRQSNGTTEFSLLFKATGGKLIDQSGKVVTNLILESDGAIRLTDANNKTVGYISPIDDTWQVESPKRTKTLFTFQQEANGNATLVRNDGSTLYALEASDGGYIVEVGKGNRYTVNISKGNGQLQTDEGDMIMATDGAIAPAALASFGFAKLTQAQQAGLAYALSSDTP